MPCSFELFDCLQVSNRKTFNAIIFPYLASEHFVCAHEKSLIHLHPPYSPLFISPKETKTETMSFLTFYSAQNFWLCISKHTPILRLLPLLLTIPLLVLYSIDLSRFLSTAALSASNAIPIVDGLSLAFLGLSVLWTLVLLSLRHFERDPSLVLCMVVDALFWAALLGLGNTTLPLRSTGKNCERFEATAEAEMVWTCAGEVLAQMQTAGALMILNA